MSRSLSVAFVLPYGEPDPGFFPDTLMELCAASARKAGHRARIVRAYYDGKSAERDAEVRARLTAWLAEQKADVVVVERLFDPEPIAAHLRGAPGRVAVGLCWGSWDPMPGVEWVLGLATGAATVGRTRRSPAAGDLVRAFAGLLEALARGSDPLDVLGVTHVGVDGLESRGALEPAPLPVPFAPALDHDVICLGETPRRLRRHLFGNAGCPYAADPTESSEYAQLQLAVDGSLSLLGCAFCHAGGDYQKRPDADVVASLLEQARYFQSHDPTVEELVIVDQHPVGYLAELLTRARDSGLRPARWLFQTRADAFVRARERIREALVAAEGGHQLEVYLIGFESFSDRELRRYNKGVTAAELVAAVAELRALRREFPERFEFARARGHSLVLFSPWTTPDDLAQSVALIREHDLSELFSELGRNRLRLYRDLPIYYLAERDGALSQDWDVEGAGRRKGYAQEQPWHFLDPRTRDAYALATMLRDRLGTETELDQLAAIVEHVRAGEVRVADVCRDVDALTAALDRIAQSPGRAATTRGFPCRLDRGAVPVFEGPGPFVLAGGEPLDRADIVALIERAGSGGREVAVVTRARACADAGFVDRLVGAGLTAAGVQVNSAMLDAEALAGLRNLRDRGVRIELRVSLTRENLPELERFVPVAEHLGIPRLRVEVALDAVGLDQLDSACAALERLSASCRQAGVSLDASPLSAGVSWYEPVPI